MADWNIELAKHFTLQVPAGDYYIGDICYALSDAMYDDVFGGTLYTPGIYQEKRSGRLFAVAATSFGDGEFRGSDGKRFSVDAGVIGIVSKALVSKDGNGGHFYNFPNAVTCTFGYGTFEFSDGSVYMRIRTA